MNTLSTRLDSTGQLSLVEFVAMNTAQQPIGYTLWKLFNLLFTFYQSTTFLDMNRALRLINTAQYNQTELSKQWNYLITVDPISPAHSVDY